MHLHLEKWFVGLLFAVSAAMRDECTTAGGPRPIHRYRLCALYALRSRSGRLKPHDPTLDGLSALGLLHYRGRRAGRRVHRPIQAIGRPVSAWDVCYTDRPAPAVRSLQRVPGGYGRNINNLVYPGIARHAVQPFVSISCGSLNICSARNKIEGIDCLMRDHLLDILALCETWHESADCITIGRLRELGYNVIEQSRPIAIDASTDNVDYVNHGGVALLSKPAFRVYLLRAI